MRLNKKTIAFIAVASAFILLAGSCDERPDGGNTSTSEPFQVKIDTVTETSVCAAITPSDMNMPYTVMSIDKVYYDEIPDDRTMFGMMVEQYSFLAQSRGMRLQDFLNEYILRHGESTITVEDLSVHSEYYLLTVGLSQDGEQLSELIKTPFSTSDIKDSGVTFDIQLSTVNTDISVEIVPSDETARYYWGIVESSWVEESGRSIKDILQESISFLLSEGESIDDITTAGRTEHQWSMQAETEYIVYAFTVTGTGLINSDVHTETVVTNIPAPSENILTLTVSNIGPDYADYRVTATTADPYVFLVEASSKWKGMEDSDILNTLTEQSDFNDQTNVWDIDGTLTGLLPDTEYYAMAFGYKSGGATTSLVKFVFRTATAQ